MSTPPSKSSNNHSLNSSQSTRLWRKTASWCRLHLLSSSCRVVVVKTTSACSVFLSPRFHVDHAYKPLCPTLKRLCGQPQGKSCREFRSAFVRSTSRRLFGETSKQTVYSARTRPTSASTVCVVKRWHCHFYLQTSLPTNSRPCIVFKSENWIDLVSDQSLASLYVLLISRSQTKLLVSG